MDTRIFPDREYRPRIADAQLSRLLGVGGAVVIEGPRACGKTMTGLHAARSAALLDDPAVRSLMELSPQAVLAGERPRLLDEWQLAPDLWNLVRREVDASKHPGSFILTGSAVPSDDLTRHTGAGRFLRMRLRTMTWAERGGSTGAVSLGALIDGERPVSDTSSMAFEEVVEEMSRTGFPALAQLAPAEAAVALRSYVDDVVRADLGRLAEVRHEPALLRALLLALARSTASEVSWQTLAKDLRQAGPAITPETVSRYVALLERLFVVERVPAWVVGLRSRARLRSAPKWHLADPALALAVLDADAARLSQDPQTAGLIFESAVVHDLLVLAQDLDGTLCHYRDSNGHELDAVITLPGGRWVAIEVKLGASQIKAGAESLAKAVAQVDPAVAGEPVLRLVVTGTGPILTLPDGTVTCPLSALGA
ncbi:ATP-binding protein [Actinomyces bovis]|uniref:ATP-binding protein n=1 Tax=Actinomyces bovis TaxID=1658 RepID=UPI001E5CBD41|nr:DUF4143 domain-containing protein [Actinomyces bovis]